MIKKYQYILLIAVLLVSVQCKKDALLIADLTGIDLVSGNTLVGIITDSKSGKPIEGIIVSDGFTSTKTDDKGVYQIKKNKVAAFVQYVIPEDYEVQISDGLPLFYEKIELNYKIFRKDFRLTKMKNGVEKNFTLFCLADPQVKTESDMIRFKTETIVDINETVEQTEASYGLILGDIVFDSPELMEPMRRLFSEVNVKFFPVIGNHDHNQYATNDLAAGYGYEAVFGPRNYSFNRGNGHIVVMDNVIYFNRDNYTGGFTDDQIAWLKNDLQFVPKDKIIVLGLHIPMRNKDNLQNSKEIYALIEPYSEVHIMSGHTHDNQNIKHTNSNIYEHIHAAACGAWWTSTINADGTPNGYGVYEIESNQIKNWYYKSTFYDKKYQIRMYPKGSFGEKTNDIVANIWNADDDWKVELYEDNIKSGDMIRETNYDNAVYYFYQMFGIAAQPNRSNNESTSWYKRPNHLFRFAPKSSKSKITIKATDRFGNIYTQDQFTTSIALFSKYNK